MAKRLNDETCRFCGLPKTKGSSAADVKTCSCVNDPEKQGTASAPGIPDQPSGTSGLPGYGI